MSEEFTAATRRYSEYGVVIVALMPIAAHALGLTSFGALESWGIAAVFLFGGAYLNRGVHADE